MAEEDYQGWERFQSAPPEAGAAIVAESLASQLGSDQSDIDLGRTDMRRLSIINPSDVAFLIYAKMRARKARVWRMIYDEFLNLKPSVGGRGRRDIIRMEQVSRGGQVSVEGEIIKPGVLARNIYDRDWEQRERMRVEG